MNIDRKYRNFARVLTDLSKENGLVTESKVSEVLQGLTQADPHGLKQILRAYQYYIEREIRFSTATIEHAGALSEEAIDGIRQKLQTEYGRTIETRSTPNPKLLAGIRIRVGDDVIDNSVSGRLEHFKTQVH